MRSNPPDHIRTGFAHLDDLLGGGLPRGGLVYLNGLSYSRKAHKGLAPAIIDHLSDGGVQVRYIGDPDTIPLNMTVGVANVRVLTESWQDEVRLANMMSYYARKRRVVILLLDHPVRVVRDCEGDPSEEKLETSPHWRGKPYILRVADIGILHHNAERRLRVKIEKARLCNDIPGGWVTLPRPLGEIPQGSQSVVPNHLKPQGNQ